MRGRIDLFINGSYWIGAAVGAVAALFFLSSTFATNVGWRLAFGVGAVFGLLILVVRRNVPESPRWLFIHGREEEAEQIVDSIEREVESESDEHLAPVDKTITVRQRKTIPFREIAKVAFSRYPKRTVLGFALFIGQAFLYNALTFDLGTLLGQFFGVSSGSVPYYTAIFGVSNFLGPFVLGRLFDTLGRRPMVSLCYLGSAGFGVLLAFLVNGGGLTRWSFMALLLATFFLASAGASSAYLTVSEIFPMETRALAIAFFYAIGTAVGGITGPLLFGHLIDSGENGQLALGFFIGAGAMLVGGIAELLFGVEAAGRSLEEIAEPLTAEGQKAEGRPRREPARGRRLGPYAPGRSPGYPVSFPMEGGTPGVEAEVETISRVLGERDQPLRTEELARAVGAVRWGPGRFRRALREAQSAGRIRRASRDTWSAA